MAAFEVICTDMDASGREMDLAPSAEALPGRVRMSMPAASGIIPGLIGLSLFVFVLYSLSAARGNVPFLVIIGIAALIGVGLEAFGIRMLVTVREWDFSTDSVVSRSRGILGWRTWEEPLSAYRGVVGRREYKRGLLEVRADPLCIVELRHRDRRDRDVRLFASSRGEKFRARQAHYARLFGLPAITPTPAGEVVRRPEEAGLPLRRRPPDWVAFAAGLRKSPPGDGLVVTAADGLLTIETSRSPKQLLREAGRAVLIVGLGAWPELSPHTFDVAIRPPLIRTTLPVAIAIYVGALFFQGELWSGRERLMLSADRVTYERLFLWRRRTELHMDSIDEVVVASQPITPWELVVRIRGYDGRIAFGRVLSRAEKQWVR